MDQGMNIELKQKQNLQLNQQLVQSIQMLQLNKLELLDYIDKQVLENPVLEIEYTDQHESLERDREDFIDHKEYMRKIENHGYEDYSVHHNDRSEDYAYLNFAYEDKNLYMDLNEQLFTRRLSKKEYQIGEMIIENIDHRGFFIESLQFIANQTSSSISFVEDVLKIIQSFDPIGIGARDVTECLLIQAKDRDDPLLMKIITEHLDDIASNQLNRIKEKLKVPMDLILKKIEIIKSLNPKPGASYFQGETTKYIIPDARIEKHYERYKVTMLNDFIPNLYISPQYLQLVKNDGGDKETKYYVNRKMSSAQWLINSIAQRQETIHKILDEIVKTQFEFFEKGVKYLKPLRQKDMADMINVHESTISRATTNKYVETPQGIFELKYFFSSAINTDFGEEISAKAIKANIQDIVTQENKKKPLSDEKIRLELEELGYIISRRTVAKYRTELNIPASSKRKEF